MWRSIILCGFSNGYSEKGAVAWGDVYSIMEYNIAPWNSLHPMAGYQNSWQEGISPKCFELAVSSDHGGRG
jgi:hypothetical protein